MERRVSGNLLNISFSLRITHQSSVASVLLACHRLSSCSVCLFGVLQIGRKVEKSGIGSARERKKKKDKTGSDRFGSARIVIALSSAPVAP